MEIKPVKYIHQTIVATKRISKEIVYALFIYITQIFSAITCSRVLNVELCIKKKKKKRKNPFRR